MELAAAYPVVVTAKLGECRDFYVERLGFGIVFEASWFVYLVAAGEGSPRDRLHGARASVAAARPRGVRRATAILLTLQVEDAAAEYERLTANGLRGRPPADRRGVGPAPLRRPRPAGVWVDVVEQIEPAEGFWERYSLGLGLAREQLVEPVVRLVHAALHPRMEHPVALLGRVEERDRLRRVRPSPRSSRVAVSTITWPGMPSHERLHDPLRR